MDTPSSSPPAPVHQGLQQKQPYLGACQLYTSNDATREPQSAIHIPTNNEEREGPGVDVDIKAINKHPDSSATPLALTAPSNPGHPHLPEQGGGKFLFHNFYNPLLQFQHSVSRKLEFGSVFNAYPNSPRRSRMAAIHTLPVELIARIFTVGVEEQGDPDDIPPDKHRFEVLVSHVCQHWRQIALRSPGLWTTIHFRTMPHMSRAKEYLKRSGQHLIDIDVDTASEDEQLPGFTLFREEFDSIFAIIIPHIHRWLSLTLKVRDLDCKASARRVLSTCGSAPKLQHLKLWHIEDWGTSERLYTAIGPPPVVVFDGSLPSLRSISLIGVNLPWIYSPFLQNLTSIELALHSDEVRIPYEFWRNMLLQSPNLLKLSLHYSGPKLGPNGALDWPEEKIHLPSLREVSLTDMDNPTYFQMLFKRLNAPDVRVLKLEAPGDQDFTPFIEYLANPPPDDTSLTLSSENMDTNSVSSAHDPSSLSSRQKSDPYFPLLESLTVEKLVCSPSSWRTFLQKSPRIEHLDLNVANMAEGLFCQLFWTGSSFSPRPVGTCMDISIGKVEERPPYPYPQPSLASGTPSSSMTSAPPWISGRSNGAGAASGSRRREFVARSSEEHQQHPHPREYPHAITKPLPPGTSIVLPNLQSVCLRGMDAYYIRGFMLFRRSLCHSATFSHPTISSSTSLQPPSPDTETRTGMEIGGLASRVTKWILEDRVRDNEMLSWMREQGLLEVNPPRAVSPADAARWKDLEWDGDEEKERVEWFREEDEDEEYEELVGEDDYVESEEEDGDGDGLALPQ